MVAKARPAALSGRDFYDFCFFFFPSQPTYSRGRGGAAVTMESRVVFLRRSPPCSCRCRLRLACTFFCAHADDLAVVCDVFPLFALFFAAFAFVSPSFSGGSQFLRIIRSASDPRVLPAMPAVHFVNCYSFDRFTVVPRPLCTVRFFLGNLFPDFGPKSSAHIRRMASSNNGTQLLHAVSIPDSAKTPDYLRLSLV